MITFNTQGRRIWRRRRSTPENGAPITFNTRQSMRIKRVKTQEHAGPSISCRTQRLWLRIVSQTPIMYVCTDIYLRNQSISLSVNFHIKNRKLSLSFNPVVQNGRYNRSVAALNSSRGKNNSTFLIRRTPREEVFFIFKVTTGRPLISPLSESPAQQLRR